MNYILWGMNQVYKKIYCIIILNGIIGNKSRKLIIGDINGRHNKINK